MQDAGFRLQASRLTMQVGVASRKLLARAHIVNTQTLFTTRMQASPNRSADNGLQLYAEV